MGWGKGKKKGGVEEKTKMKTKKDRMGMVVLFSTPIF